MSTRLHHKRSFPYATGARGLRGCLALVLLCQLLVGLAPGSAPQAAHAAPSLWSGTGKMAVGRAAHSTTLLPNGHVLVAGGENPSGVPLTNGEAPEKWRARTRDGSCPPYTSMAVRARPWDSTLLT
jgi:hypothetical protein